MNLFTHTNLIITIGVILLGFTAGSFGNFLTIRRQNHVGEALSHATLPGVVLAFALTGINNIGWLLLGAAASSLFALALFHLIKRYSKIDNDTTLGLLMTGFFGLGQLGINLLVNNGQISSGGLNNFLVGQVASLLISDLYFTLIVTGIFLLIITLFWKEIQMFTFDRSLAKTSGFSSFILEALLLMITILIIVTGLQTMGIILTAALLIIPSIAARFWTVRLSTRFFLAGGFGVSGGLLGVLFINLVPQVPLGPVIVIIITIIFFISLLCGRRGLISNHLAKRQAKAKREVNL